VSAEFTDEQIRAYAAIVYMHDHVKAYRFLDTESKMAFEWMLIEPTSTAHRRYVWERMEAGLIVFNHNDAFDKLAEFIIPHGEGSDSVRVQGCDVDETKRG